MIRRMIAPFLFLILFGTFISGAAMMAAHSNGINLLGALVPARYYHSNSQNNSNSQKTNKPADQPATASSTSAKSQSSTKNSSSSTTTVSANTNAKLIGVFTEDSPSDPASSSWLDKEKSLGINVVYNYSAYDGSVAQVNSYLDHAQSLGIKVIIDLHPFYDQYDSGFYQSFRQFGNSDEEVALNIVRNFANHPAVWGFSITDERPESTSDLGTWKPILQDRYNKIKAINTKPIMIVLVGATSPSASSRQSFLKSLRSGTDHYALDYYPIPYQSINPIADYAHDLTAVGDSDGWFIAQAFSWNANSDYAATAQALGFNPNNARLPTSIEMSSMAALALNNGAKNILFYHYYDIRRNQSQLNALRDAIARLH